MAAAVELRRENRYLRGKGHMLKLELSTTEEAAKEAMNEVINISKAWAVQAFEMLAEEDDIPRYVRRLEFQESLHKNPLKMKRKTKLKPKTKRTTLLQRLNFPHSPSRPQAFLYL